MAQITSVTSEALQAEIRRLLPSQQGFGEDLQASNVITPVIDLTRAAEGSSVPVQLQEAQAFGSQTAFDVSNTTATLANTAGFWNLKGVVNVLGSSTVVTVSFNLSDGSSTKQIYEFNALFAASVSANSNLIDFTVFLRAGDSFTVTSNNVLGNFAGSIRQIADVNGNLVNPVGFTPQ